MIYTIFFLCARVCLISLGLIIVPHQILSSSSHEIGDENGMQLPQKGESFEASLKELEKKIFDKIEEVSKKGDKYEGVINTALNEVVAELAKKLPAKGIGHVFKGNQLVSHEAVLIGFIADLVSHIKEKSLINSSIRSLNVNHAVFKKALPLLRCGGGILDKKCVKFFDSTANTFKDPSLKEIRKSAFYKEYADIYVKLNQEKKKLSQILQTFLDASTGEEFQFSLEKLQFLRNLPSEQLTEELIFAPSIADIKYFTAKYDCLCTPEILPSFVNMKTMMAPGWLGRSGHPEKYRKVTQGWKFHVSATPQAAAKVLSVVCPYLVTNHIKFKFPMNLRQMNRVYNESETQLGKFIAIYSIDEEHAKKIAMELDHLLSLNFSKADFVKNPIELNIGHSAGLFVRYGAYYGHNIYKVNSKGEYLDENGNVVNQPTQIFPDDRKVWRPEFVTWNPFEDLFDSNSQSLSNPTKK